MQQLQFVELDEGGRLVVATEDGVRYAVPVDDRLRAALRPRPTTTTTDRGPQGVRLREVQSMIRAGQSAQEVAAVTGWEVERVRRYEGPVLAEREHVITLAQRAPVRDQGRTDGSHTLGDRVRERLQGRDVDVNGASWDAARSTAHGPWTVQVIFSAGGRERRAAWRYDLRTRGLESLDDEARWLSEDEQALPGGLAGHPLLGGGHGEDEVAADLMASMRERRQRRSRRSHRDRGEAGDDPAQLPGQQAMPPEVLPLEELPYDPETMGDPPAAHPGGAAQESPNPPTESDEETGEPGPAPGRASTRQPRRRLRASKLPEAVDPPVDQDGETEDFESYARLRDPAEVSFDEFFEIDEEQDQALDQALEEQVEPDGKGGPGEGERLSSQEDLGEEPEAEPDEAEPGGSEPTVTPEPAAQPEPAAEPAAQEPRPSPGRKGRPSVPSWDDIMFGARDRG